MSYVYGLDFPHHLAPSEMAQLIGAKATNLAVMRRELKLAVPPGFAITTVACNVFLSDGWPNELDAEIETQLRAVEDAVGRRLGDPRDPLLLSVRSGAPVSMPGMMDTILNLGLNSETTAGLASASGDAAFARDCHDRLQQMFTDVVGVDTVPEQPWKQLRTAVEAVFRSWNSERARSYRQREGIPDALGTAVTVQAMVFGNLGPNSGTGVLFTRNPSTGEPTIYGEFLFGAQGEDVVAGAHQTHDIAVLDERLPVVAQELWEAAATLERHFADLCDIEFTVERGKLWLLQVRPGKRSPQAALRIALDMAESEDFPLSRQDAVRRVAGYLVHPPTCWTGKREGFTPIASGLPASPGVGTGEIVTSTADAQALAAAGQPLILVRTETSPKDVPSMALAAGLLTTRGGLTCHAAVVARSWSIPAVVGANDVHVSDRTVIIGGQTLRVGEILTIDGSTGEIFVGRIPGESTVVPEAVTLLAWAEELGIQIGEGDPEAAASPLTTRASADDVIRLLAIKEVAAPDGLASAVLAAPDYLGSLLDELTSDGLITLLGDFVRLTDTGKAVAQDLLAKDQVQLGAPAAITALDAFVALDGRVKDAVTAWQLRMIDGQPVANDHTDAVHDRHVLDQLSNVHADTVDWFRPLVVRLPRFSTYSARLGRALQAAFAGDERFVASPQVDSYHSVWFELHEDLIRLAGRSRSDEVAAGRA
jgi:pyruvate,orthophosphate dikinase